MDYGKVIKLCEKLSDAQDMLEQAQKQVEQAENNLTAATAKRIQARDLVKALKDELDVLVTV